jgi:hypothetical protein
MRLCGDSAEYFCDLAVNQAEFAVELDDGIRVDQRLLGY